MKRIKNVAIAMFSAIALTGAVNAQYLGIEQLAVTKDFEPKLLLNAIQKKNWEFVERWEKEKGFKFPYDNNTDVYCSFQRMTSMFKNNHPLHTQNVPSLASMVADSEYPYFTACEKLPLLHLQAHIKLENTPSIQPFFATSQGKARIDEKAAEEAKIIYDFQMSALEQLEPNQWDVLITMIVNNRVDSKLRDRALDKFLEWYPNHMNTATERQKMFLETGANLQYKMNFHSDHRLASSRLKNPVNYIFEQIMRNTVASWQVVSNSQFSKNTPEFNSNYWKSPKNLSPKDFKFGDLKKAKKRELTNFIEHYYLAHTNGELIKRIMKAPGFDINQQDSIGNTFFGSLFIDTDSSFYQLMANNLNFAIFIRHTLENKANPMLLNEKGNTPYMIFEDARKGHSAWDHLNNAFVLKQYPH